MLVSSLLLHELSTMVFPLSLSFLSQNLRFETCLPISDWFDSAEENATTIRAFC